MKASKKVVAPIGTKPSKKTVSKAVKEAVSGKPVEIFGLGETPYATLVGNRMAYAGWIIALGLTSGCIKFQGDGVVNTGSGKPEAIKKLTGTAYSHWKNKLDRINENGFTAKGITEMSLRLQGKAGQYSTTKSIVQEAVNAQTIGGIAKINGLELKMSSKPETF